MQSTLRHLLLYFLMLLWVQPLAAAPITWPCSDEVLNQTSDQIRNLIMRANTVRLSGIPLALPEQVSRFYQQREFKVAWSENEGILIEAAELLQALKRSEEEGLPTRDYPVKILDHYLYNAIDGPLQLAQLDILLTDAFMHYSRNVRSGRFSPRRAGGDWLLPYTRFDATDLLAQVLKEGTMSEALAALPPSNERYRRLRKVLQQYRAVAAQGGWPKIEPGETLLFGSRGQRVIQLRERLRMSGDFKQEKVDDPELFDSALNAAVLEFQSRHGLRDDGSVGKSTLAVLNVPVEVRIRQIEVNMERWRWLPREMPARYIIVNMAGYELEVINANAHVMTMRVIVGRDYRQTPVLASEVTTLILNPDWIVPPTIIREDVLPQLQRNPARLEKLNLQLYSNGSVVDPRSVSWSTVNPDHFPYTLRQEPGPKNPLGRIKFLLHNSDGIYLHDTPDRDLFNKPDRALSSGCIRLEHPVELALNLLDDPVRWSRGSLEEAINAGKTIGLTLPEPMPIYLTYWTDWVDEAGALQIREDIYRRDRRLLRLWEKNAT